MHKQILDVSKRRGIMYPSFEIYGGVGGFYDYGPIGSRIKKNIEDLVRRYYIIEEGCFEVECPTLSPEAVWVASGHVSSFSDLMTECLKCGEPYRADHLIEEHTGKSCEASDMSAMDELVKEYKIKCPKCGGGLDRVYSYNLMFQTFIGPGKNKEVAYLRPETAQTTYLGFRRLWEIARKKLPFGVIQIGRSFRNEISPRQGMIRLREFNQAEIQFFVEPDGKYSPRFDTVSAIKAKVIDKEGRESSLTLKEAVEKGIVKLQMIAYFLGRSLQLFKEMGINPEALRLRQHKDEERAFYSTDTWDIEYMSSVFGKIELVGVSDRTDYDLSAHMKLSKQDMTVNYEGRKFIPHVVEVAYGIDRPFYCVIESCYREEGDRVFFSFPEDIAPYKAGVFPLVGKDGLPEKAQQVFDLLKKEGLYVFYDEGGSIGKRYARADEVGVPICVTIDYETLEDDTVTLRDRDTKKQDRVKIDGLCKAIVR
ncbi:MAG: glycine--tRNA ligase [Candidatus Altiarchaeota archaeon]|nr:glycine--tRNA ligase [Candidatus Altiarchaeota archaeon]